MPQRQTLQSITVVRNKKNVVVPPGQIFDFTDEEIDELMPQNAITAKVTVDLSSDPAAALKAGEITDPNSSGPATETEAAAPGKKRKGTPSDEQQL